MENSVKKKMESIDVCIVGGGIAGLSTAIALQQIGLKVRIFERDLRFADRKQGYGLTLTKNMCGPLAKLGILEACVERNCPSHCHYIFNPQGEILGYYGRALKTDRDVDRRVSATSSSAINSGGNIGNLRIPRQELRKIMLSKLEPNTIEWGWKVLDFVERRSEVLISFQRTSTNGSNSGPSNGRDTSCQRDIREIRAGLLVGADGIRSHVRELRDSKIKVYYYKKQGAAEAIAEKAIDRLNYLGVAVIIGLSRATHPLIDARGFYVLDGKHRMFTMPYSTEDLPYHSMFAPSSSGNEMGISSLSTAPSSSKDMLPDKDHSAVSAPPAVVTMWQLSFSGLSEEEALQLRRASPSDLLANATSRTHSWFAPVQDMIMRTLPGEVWGTPLYDRDPMPALPRWADALHSSGRAAGGSAETATSNANHLVDANQISDFTSADQRSEAGLSSDAGLDVGASLDNGIDIGIRQYSSNWGADAESAGGNGKGIVGSRVTVVGDACHPMSMFKGQGANQALEDGPLLAKWLLNPPGKAKSKKAMRKRFKGSGDGKNMKKMKTVNISHHLAGDGRDTTEDQSFESGFPLVLHVSPGNCKSGEDMTTTLTQISLPAREVEVRNKEPTGGVVDEARARERLLLAAQTLLCYESSLESLYTRLRCFEREMVARSSSKVQASRAMARHLHFEAVLQDEFGVEGAETAMVTRTVVVDTSEEVSGNRAIEHVPMDASAREEPRTESFVSACVAVDSIQTKAYSVASTHCSSDDLKLPLDRDDSFDRSFVSVKVADNDADIGTDAQKRPAAKRTTSAVVVDMLRRARVTAELAGQLDQRMREVVLCGWNFSVE